MGNLIDWEKAEHYADNWTELIDCMAEFLVTFGDEAFDLAVEQAQNGARSNIMMKASIAAYDEIEAHMRADAGEFLAI